MDDVVEQVAERCHGALGGDGVVVRAEDADQALIARERLPHAGEHVRMDEDVGVDEEDDVALSSPRRRGCGPQRGRRRAGR